MIYISTEAAAALVLGAMLIWILNYITKPSKEPPAEQEPSPSLQADYTRELTQPVDDTVTLGVTIKIGGDPVK